MAMFAASLARAHMASAVVDLRVDTTVALAAETTVTVTVTNTGDETVTTVRPDATLRGQAARGEPLPTLPPGGMHTWSLALPPPDEPGSFAVFVEVHATDAAGAHPMVPSAAVVATPGLLEPAVGLTATAGPVARTGNVTVVVNNPEPTPLYGRLAVLLPTGLDTEPRARAVPAPPHGHTDVSVLVQSRGASAGRSYPALAVFEYTLAERRHAVLAFTTVPVVPPPARARALSVGAGAMALAFAALAVAWRLAARRRAAAA